MLILLLTLLQLRFEVRDAGLELVENAHDAGLLGEGGERELELSHAIPRYANNFCPCCISYFEQEKTM